MGHIRLIPPITIPTLLRFQSEKGKKGEETWEKTAPRQHSKNWRKMKRKNTKPKQQQGCDVAKLIDTIEKAAEIAMKIYRIVKAILRNGGKTK
jgi:hypothetical protein